MSAHGMTRRVAQVLAILGLALFAALVTGCGAKAPSKLEPKVSPPAIKVAGTLRAGVDLSQPPFGGVDHGTRAGLDLDTAAALADELGLKLEVVSVPPSEAATALAQGKVDVVFSVPFADESLANVSLAGSYVSDAPAFFIATDSTASVDPTMTLDTLAAPKIGAQKKSATYWRLLREVGATGVKPYATLREAIEALDAGKIEVIAGDALVASYIVRDFPRVHFAGQLDAAVPLGVAVAPDNTKLGDAVRDALDGLAADGVLVAIRNKWVDGLPKLTAAESTETGSTTATGTP